MDTQEDKQKVAGAQAAPEEGQGKPTPAQRLSAIEQKLLNDRLYQAGRDITAAVRNIREIISGLSFGSGSTETPIYAMVEKYLRYNYPDGGDLQKAIPPEGRDMLVKKLSEAFLAKVDEIREVADEALSQSGGR